ncbi:hypothetical protein Tco_1258386, partial [Tanacetum coccineum]
KLSAFTWSWDELVVRVQSLSSNPSLPLALYTISPLKGIGLSGIIKWKSYRGIGLWEMVRGELGDVLGRVVLAINRGRGGYKVGGKWGGGTVMVQVLKGKNGEEAKMALTLSSLFIFFLSRNFSYKGGLESDQYGPCVL